MNVVLNGTHRAVPDDAGIDDVLAMVDAPDRGVAVAVDSEVVPRAQWDAVRLHEGARIEVVQAVQGG